MDRPRFGVALALAALCIPASARTQSTLQQAVARKLVAVFGQPLRGHARGVTAVQYRPDGKQVLSAGAGGQLRLWSASSGQLVRKIDAHADSVHFATFYDAGSKIVSVGRDRTAGFFDARTGAEIGRIRDLPEKLGEALNYFAWHVTADGKHLLVEDPTRRAARLLRVDLAGRTLAEPLALAGGDASNFAVSPDGRYLALVQRGEFFETFLHIYDLSEQKTVVREKAPYANALLFSPDGAQLFAPSRPTARG